MAPTQSVGTRTNFQTQGLTWDNDDLAVRPSYSPSANQSERTTNTWALTRWPASPEIPLTIIIQPPPPSYEELFLPSYSDIFPNTCLPISRKAFADCCIKSSDAAKMFAKCCMESGNTAIGACTPSQETCFEIKQSARECGEVLNSQHTVSIPSGIIGLALCINNEAIAGSVCCAWFCLIEAIGYCEKNSRRI